MKSSAAFVLAALAAIANAIQFDFGGAFTPEAGVPITLKWSGAVGSVTITLKNGPSDDLKTVEVLTSGETDGSFTWTPSEDLPSDTYALEITDGSDTNYSPQFVFEGDGTATTSATPSATTTQASSTLTSETTTSETTSISSVSNSTMSSTTMTTTTKATKTATDEEETSEPTTTPVNQNGSQRLASSLALVIGAVAAFAVFN